MRPAAAAHHVAQNVADQDEHRGEVDGDHVVPLLVLHAHEEIVVGDAGIVDEDVDLAERLLRLFAELDHRRAITEVARKHEHAAAELGGKRVELLLVGARDRNVSALSVQRLGDRPANSARGAGDERALAFKVEHRTLLS